jgi:RNA polymerase sigma factor for flagellar operon FliA
LQNHNAAALAAFGRHRPLAERIARKYRRRFHGNTLPEEVSAAALVGLWQAALSQPKLPPEQFEAFASVRIKGAILDEIRAHDPLPRRARKNLGQVVLLSIDATKGVGHGDSTEQQLLAQFSVEPTSEQELFMKERLALVAPAIAKLRRRERDVLARLMRRATVEVARDLGVSEARISQIYARIVGKLQCSLGLVPARTLAARDWRAIKAKAKKP